MDRVGVQTGRKHFVVPLWGGLSAVFGGGRFVREGWQKIVREALKIGPRSTLAEHVFL